MKTQEFNISYEQGLERAKKYNLENEYQECINNGMSPIEACFEWDI